MKKYRVVLIDDDVSIQKLVKYVLGDENFELMILADAFSITEKLKYLPDIILMDIKLYKISGIDALVKIRSDKRLKNVPIIAFTAYAMKGDKDSFIKMGFDGYISKPIDTREFSRQIRYYIKNNT
ncbi:MAG: response regulator [Spirochaetes bacterium]|nr:response regulator [Spirochaetota bacterium]